MKSTLAIVQRELAALFFSPIGYIVVAGFLLVTGVLATLAFQVFEPGKEASLRQVFLLTPFTLTIILPAITMRMISEEYRSGTIESLMTAPVTDSQMVLGKFLAAVVFYLVLLGSTLIYPILLATYGNPDWGATWSTYLGLLLIGLMFLAFGLFASALTANQVVAWMLGAVPLMLFAWLGYYLVDKVPKWLVEVFLQINVVGRFDRFSRGLIESDGVVFFLATTAFFVFLSVKVVESRRWR